MGSKNQPGTFDCYHNALPDEPMFVLLARDPSAPDLVDDWATERKRQIDKGHRPASDNALVDEAVQCAAHMRHWRVVNNGAWRGQPAAAPAGREEIARAFLYETGMFDNEAEIKANPEHRLVKAAYAAADRLLSPTAPEPRHSSDEPIREDNYMSNDLDKGDGA